MSFGTEHKEPAESPHLLICVGCAGIASELDVDAATRDVGRDGDGATSSRLCNHLTFAFVILCIQYFVRNSFLFEMCREQFVLLDGDRAHQDRLTLLMELLHLSRNGAVFAGFILEDEIIEVISCDRAIGRDNDGVESVYLIEFLRRGDRGTGHTGKLRIEAEIVLERDTCEGS